MAGHARDVASVPPLATAPRLLLDADPEVCESPAADRLANRRRVGQDRDSPRRQKHACQHTPYPGPPMSTNRDLIRKLYAAFASGDAGTVLGAFHPDIRWNEAEGWKYAEGNPYVGPQRVGEGVFGRLMTEWDGFSVRSEQILADGDDVVAFGRYAGTYKGTGQPLDAQFVHRWTVRDGKVAGFQQYTDTAQFQRVMGAATDSQ